MQDPPGINNLLPALLDLVAEIAVDYAVSSKDLQRRLRFALAQAGRRRGRSHERTAKLFDVAPATVRSWDAPSAPEVRSLWDATNQLFEERESWTLQEIHERLRDDFRGSRSANWSYEVTETIVERLVQKGSVRRDQGTYVAVESKDRQQNRLPDSEDQYRDFVDYRIAHWVNVARTQRNASREDIERFRTHARPTTRPLGDTSYIAHDFRVRAAKTDSDSAHERLNDLIEGFREIVEAHTETNDDEPSVPIHLQVLYRILDDDTELRA